MQRTTLEVSRHLRQIPGVRNFGAHIGQAFLGEEVAGVNLGENWISIDPSVDYDETLDAIEDVNDAYPGLFRETQTYLDERIEEVISGGKEPIVVRVFGPDLQVLREKAAEIEEIMGGIEGLEDEHTDISTDVPQLQVEVNLAEAQKFGLKPGDVRRAAATLVAGEEVGDIFRAGKAYDVMVWSTPETRNSVQAIQNLRIDTPSGAPGPARRRRRRVPASPTPTPSTVRATPADSTSVPASRDATSDRRSSRSCRPSSAASSSTRATTPRSSVSTPSGRRHRRRLMATAVLAAAAILLLLQASFGSWRAGAADLPDPAHGSGRRRHRGLRRRRRDLPRLAGRLLHRLRHRRPQRHPADQPLPAPRAGGGRDRSAATSCCAAPGNGWPRS